MKKYIIYIAVLLLAYYVSPLIIKDTGSAMFVLLLLVPIVNFVLSFIYGVKCKFNIIYPLISGILFIPTIFIYYNSTATFYIVVYIVISLVGLLLGRIFYKKEK